VLGGKAYEATKAANLPASIQAVIDQAPKYAEGRGVRIPVRNAADADDVRTLAAIKFAHRRHAERLPSCSSVRDHRVSVRGIREKFPIVCGILPVPWSGPMCGHAILEKNAVTLTP
jgi:hypothetical protein